MHGEVIAMRKLRQSQGVQCRESSADFRSEEWIDNEVVGCEFEDVRHGKRLRQLLEQFSGRVGATTPWACQDWANTKAAYRFFGNERISESNILAGHFACTRERFPLAVASPFWFFTTRRNCLIGTKIPHRSESLRRYLQATKGVQVFTPVAAF